MTDETERARKVGVAGIQPFLIPIGESKHYSFSHIVSFNFAVAKQQHHHHIIIVFDCSMQEDECIYKPENWWLSVVRDKRRILTYSRLVRSPSFPS